MKTILQIKKEYREIQRAIKFLVDCCLDKKGDSKIENKKTFMHSLRVGFDLLKRGYDKNIIIGAILHDVKEDAGVSIKEIKKRFGKKVAKIVEAVSFKTEIKDKKERYLDNYKRIIKAGKKTMIVSVADHLDNADFYKYIKKKTKKEYIKEKWKTFLKMIAPKIPNEPITKELKEKMEKLFIINKND